MKDNPKRDLILKAASECFARFGFDKTTLDDIGRRAGLNKASLYYYFKNKEEIFKAVALADMQAFVADLQAKALAFPDVRKQLRYFLTERIRRCGEVIHLTKVSVDNLQTLKPLLDEAYQETKARELTFLTELVRKAAQENALAIQEPSVSLAGRLFQLSDAFKNDGVHTAGRFASNEINFDDAIAQVDYWVKIVLR